MSASIYYLEKKEAELTQDIHEKTMDLRKENSNHEEEVRRLQGLIDARTNDLNEVQTGIAILRRELEKGAVDG